MRSLRTVSVLRVFISSIQNQALYSLFWGTYQLDMSQLQMAIAEYITQLWMCHYITFLSAVESPIHS
jgi:hypothetical protein